MRWNLKEVGWQISGLTNRNHIRLWLRIRLHHKLKSNNYSELAMVMWQIGGEKEKCGTEGGLASGGNRVRSHSNNEWQEVSKSHSTITVANIMGRAEL